LSDAPLSVLFGALLVLILLSAFFSGSETGMMSLNRYRLRHLAEKKLRGALRAQRLLERPDRLIGLILIGNNFVNILASSIATVIALRLFGEAGIAIAAGLLTLVILIFAEVAPKTVAALHPERVAFPASAVLMVLQRLLYPLVWAVNMLANGVLRVIGVSAQQAPSHSLSSEELRTVVNEAGALIPRRHQEMLLNILDLEKVTVEDIMVPRNEVVGIDLEDEWEEILEQLVHCQHTRLPVYRDSIDDVMGILHARNVLSLLGTSVFDKEQLIGLVREPYYIPEGTALHRQLLNFQRSRRRIGLVVDEYGDIQGLVTLEDILEEIIGEFTTDVSALSRDIHPQDDGSLLVDAGVTIRELNRLEDLDLPTDGPKTLNGLVLEYLEDIPEAGTSLKLAGYPIEIVQTTGNAVKTVRILPRLDD